MPYWLPLALAAAAIYRWVIWPIFLSPLSKIPSAHPLARVTSLYITLMRWLERENRIVHAAHKARGSVILLAPSEVSVNCVQHGIQTVYGRNFNKDGYYTVFANYNGSLNMFSMLESRPHSTRKRMISHVYSKSALFASPTVASLFTALLSQRLLPHLRSNTGPVEVLSLLFGFGMDAIVGYCVGLKAGTNFTQDAAYRNYWLKLYDTRNRRPFYLQNMPALADLFSWLRVKPLSAKVTAANQEMEHWVLGMVDVIDQRIAAGKADEDEGIVYRQLKANLSKDGSLDAATVRIRVASELMDHILAGHETVAIVLCYAMHHLSLHPHWQTKLRHELRQLSPAFDSGEDLALPPFEQLDRLPLLHAIMLETLRVNASIPGLQPRRTPAGGCRLGDFNVPGRVRVSAQAYSLHREASVFPDPETWQPERWLEADADRLKEMHAWFWAFGSGGRMCIGSNFAQLEMKLVLVALYSTYETAISCDDGIEQADGYTVGPRSGRLDLIFHSIGASAARPDLS